MIIKLKTISTYFIFAMSLLTMGLGIYSNDTWQLLAGFWMMLYLSEKVDNDILRKE